jgi:pyridoxine 4-dehydrogenase
VNSLDTAYNYRGFTSHRVLARVAGDLLPQFRISTKVGFFSGAAGTLHSLDPNRLRNAIWQSVDDLGVRPKTIFLHNPERTLAGMDVTQGCDVLAAACVVLAEAAAFGLCDSWGIASWKPEPVLAVLGERSACPTPNLLMTRAGLSLDASALAVVDQVAALLDVDPLNRWGMSPFAGNTRDAAWHTTNLAPFLDYGQPHTSLQAAFRLAYDLPRITHLAVGSDNPAHLHELVAATHLRVAAGTVDRYRQLIAQAVMAGGP